MNASELRASFLDFFAKRDHRIVESSPVIPHGDPTLLFTNAGMNQFKEVLLGREMRDYKRAASVQKCVRAGGKHNDLDDVGRDGRHLTFFEMLGNWSFGDYYKQNAIKWAWEYVTQVLKLDPKRLYVSIYKDDNDSAAIWADEVGLSSDRIARFGDVDNGDEENFWSMGATGPCGPCTEIFYDQHPDSGPPMWGPGYDEDRILEVWNLVFMEFNRDSEGVFTPLPIQSVDTGMGFERVKAVLDGVDSVYHTDIFEPVLVGTARLLGQPVTDVRTLYGRDDFSSFAVIADHIRTLTFSLADGGMFSNEGRGYVLRRILRRAVRFGRQLGFEGPFLHEVSQIVSQTFGEVYHEIRATANEISRMIRIEEERFFRTIDRGIARFNALAEATKGEGGDTIDGGEAFKLYDTYGFPLDLTQIMAEEAGLAVDTDGFDSALKEQQERARSADHHHEEQGDWLNVEDGQADRSVAWYAAEHETRILRLRNRPGTEVWEVLLESTPFYAESGGQVGDAGVIRSQNGDLSFEVVDTVNTPSGFTHIAKLVSGVPNLKALKDSFLAQVDADRRFLVTCNHTATHLLHKALHDIVSDKAFQAGSLVAPDRLRFDYSFERPLTEDEIEAIETHVNTAIRAASNLVVHYDMPREEAEKMGAMAIFGEKYGDHVRVVEVPGHSVELCGGCHVSNTRQIAFFQITSETGVAAGVRRIEAITNRAAFDHAQSDQALLKQLARSLKTEVAALPGRVDKMIAQHSDLEKQADRLARRVAELESRQIAADALDIDGVAVAAARVQADNREQLLAYADAIRSKLPEAATVLLGAEIGGKPALACIVTDALFKARGLKAGDLINEVAPIVGGRGGGRPTLAQAGGSDSSKLGEAIAAFGDRVRGRLA